MKPLQKWIGIAVSATVCLTLGSNAFAQTPTIPVPLKSECGLPQMPVSGVAGAAVAKPTQALTQAFQSGDWDHFKTLVTNIRKLFESGKGCAPADSAPTAADYFVIAWTGASPLGDPGLLSTVVHFGAGDSYALRLPGITSGGTPKLYQIFIGDGPKDELAASYVSTREENPLLAQIPDVASKIFDPLIALASATQAKGRTERVAAQRKDAESGWASLARVDLPFARASVKLGMRASATPTEQGLTKTSAALKSRLSLLDVPHSTRAVTLATNLDKAMVDNAKNCLGAVPPASCLSVLDPVFNGYYNGTCTGCSDEDAKSVKLVDAEYRKLAAELGTEDLDATMDLRNVPLTRHSFGLTSGYSFQRRYKQPRAKLTDGVFESDPLDRPMTMAVFNTAFNVYDADAFAMTEAEKHRWFIGAVLTPTIGISAGYTYSPIRGLGVNVGYALLAIDAPAEGKALGEAPNDASDAFKLSYAKAWFVGLSYNFK
jgi:hypothetical protein